MNILRGKLRSEKNLGIELVKMSRGPLTFFLIIIPELLWNVLL